MAHTYAALVERLVAMVRLAETALSRASHVALETVAAAADQELAAAEAALQPLDDLIEDDAALLLAGHGTTPGDVRSVVADTHVGAEVQQLAEAIRRVGEIAWVRRTRGPLPEPARQPLGGMSSLALEMVAKAADALQNAEPEIIADLHTGLNEIGQRQRLLYGQLLSFEQPLERTDVVDAVLLSGYFERCASHALALARHAALFAVRP
ncbi:MULTISPECIES: PhoU domain-containing protein [Kitasatospora]|uniref:PhoU domain-containing protein n=1 Tax=Kitasatospora cystarginea TaxID=58350 RepID=A0ABN3ETB9_9ACTN